MTRFDTVLVANRGEIALRVIRGVAAAGLRSVAVYSDADRGAPHVRAADVAVRIGPAPAAESYLSIDALLDAAARSGADAVHPGYGFLSERPELARAVVAAGLVFVGPSADVMEAMGRKDRARQIAIAAGVPVLSAADLNALDPMSPEGLGDIARQVGFPLLVKAAAGGGGKGMRIVREPGELAESAAAARREALAAFGDDTLLFERYVESGRHIEVQVLGDEHGNVVHLYDRDCSVQRRHQKVVEEAPATAISPTVRKEILDAAVALARQVGYVNAGTVEFLVAGTDAYFLEMNTRLQVEHPVTELVTGLDLVALQLSIAQGDPLPFSQDDVRVDGHAIEARVYAEDPYHDFLPQAGLAEVVDWPSSERARVDAALESGQRVTTFYDPMLAKVVAASSTREGARRGLLAALDDTAVLGLTTNLGFLRALVGSGEFRDAAIDTAWLDNHPGGIARVPAPDVAWILAAWALATGFSADDSVGGESSAGSSAGSASTGDPSTRDPSAVGWSGSPLGPLSMRDGWRLAGPTAGIPVSLSLDEEGSAGGAGTRSRLLVVYPGGRGADRGADRDGAGRVVLPRAARNAPANGQESTPERPGSHPETPEGRSVAVRGVRRAGARLWLEIDAKVEVGHVLVGRHQVLTAYQGQTYVFARPDAFGPAASAEVGDGSVLAPMPGTVLAVRTEVGATVAVGDPLVVMEAMKMELALKAPFAGTVRAVDAKVGDQVRLGARLVLVEPVAPSPGAHS